MTLKDPHSGIGLDLQTCAQPVSSRRPRFFPSFLSCDERAGPSLSEKSLYRCSIFNTPDLTSLFLAKHFSFFSKQFFFSFFKPSYCGPRAASPALPGNECNSEWNAEVLDTHRLTDRRRQWLQVFTVALPELAPLTTVLGPLWVWSA